MAQAPTTRPEPPLLNSPVLKPGEPARSAANPVVAMFVKLPNNWPSGLNAGGVPRNPTCAAACDAAADGSAAARFWPYRSLRDASIRPRRSLTADSALLRSEEHTSELQSLMRISYAVFCLKKKKKQT